MNCIIISSSQQFYSYKYNSIDLRQFVKKRKKGKVESRDTYDDDDDEDED